MDGKTHTNHPPIAVITGISGQDGYYLSQLLLDRKYHVVGLVRPESYRKLLQDRFSADSTYTPSIEYRPFDLQDAKGWLELLGELKPDEVYHLAGMSFVPDSWKQPITAIEANVVITVKLLEALRLSSPTTKLFYACSSEIFGRPQSEAQNEDSPLKPISPYGVTKAASYQLIDVYRKQYGVFACSGILFNHESPRRPQSFVTRKISAAAAAIALGLQESLTLGNLQSRRDWGFAGDFVDCMWRMLQAQQPQDYVIGTGRHTTIQELLECAFECVGLRWQDYVQVDKSFVRANDVQAPLADPSAAKEDLQWYAQTSIRSLMQLMVESDLDLLHRSGSQKRAA